MGFKGVNITRTCFRDDLKIFHMNLHMKIPFLYISALIAEQFLERTASQLTYHGLCELNTQVKEDELAVFFRNNHFTTLYRNKVMETNSDH